MIKETKNTEHNTSVISGSNTEITGIIDQRSEESTIIIGDDCLIQGYLVTEKSGSRLIVGNNVLIGGNTVIDCAESIIIENDVLISYQCILADSDNHSLSYTIRKHDLADWKRGIHVWSTVKSAPIRICQGAWLGARVIILKGVTVGEG